MFNNDLWCLASRAMIGDRRSPQGSRQRRRDRRELRRNRRWRRRDRRYHRERDPMLNSVLNGDWSNSVPGRQIPEGQISMISNSVTHLQSYTNSAIADIAWNSAPTSPETWRERRCLRIERRYCNIKWRVFCDASQCFKSLSWCFTGVHDVLRCFSMYHVLLFNNILRCLAIMEN